MRIFAWHLQSCRVSCFKQGWCVHRLKGHDCCWGSFKSVFVQPRFSAQQWIQVIVLWSCDWSMILWSCVRRYAGPGWSTFVIRPAIVAPPGVVPPPKKAFLSRPASASVDLSVLRYTWISKNIFTLTTEPDHKRRSPGRAVISARHVRKVDLLRLFKRKIRI